MGINESGNNADVVNSFVQIALTVGTSQVEAKVGASALSGRQMLRIFNDSNAIIYFGPTGVTTATGETLFKKQSITIPLTEAQGLFLIAGSAGNKVIVSEYA